MEFYSGEFDVDGHDLSRINAQMQFLQAVKQLAPEVLDQLRSGPLKQFYNAEIHQGHWRLIPLYWLEILSLSKGETLEDMLREHGDFLKSRGYSIKNYETEIPRLTEQLEPIVQSLKEWSKATGLDADWCLARGFFTLADWVYRETEGYFSDNSKALKPVNEWSYNRPNVEVPFKLEEFKFEWAWHPGRTSRHTITKVMRELFEKELQKYLDATEASFKDQTGIKSQLKEKRAVKHFDWLALFQVRRLSYSEIVSRYFPHQTAKEPRTYLSDNTKTVRKAVNDLARFINLPLRADGTRPGRRKK